MRRLGCLLLVILAAVLAVEAWLTLLLIEVTGGEVLGVLLALAGGMLLGYWLLRWRKRRLMAAMLAGQGGRATAALLGGVLMLIPGPLTFVLGLLLQLPPVQGLCAGLAGRLLGAVMRALTRRMLGGGLPGGFPGRSPRTIDAERIDRPPGA